MMEFIDKCWYSGINLYKIKKDNIPETDWYTYSKEHLVNRSSPIYECISIDRDGYYRGINNVSASKFINSNIGVFILPMKFKLKEMYQKHCNHFQHSVIERKEFEDAFKFVFKLVKKEFKLYGAGPKNTKEYYSHPSNCLWELNCLETKLPEIKIDSLAISQLNVATEMNI